MDATERSLRLFSVYFPMSRMAFHAPVFFLFLSERFSIDDVLQLSSIYYVSVVVFEVPSGYLSDRVGRVTTLRLSSVAKIAAYTLFLVGGTRFGVHAVAEIALALHWACISGTDTSFHYDALHATGREDEYGDREARLLRRGYQFAAASVLVGGLVAVIDLRAAYVLGLVTAVGALVVTVLMREPTRDGDGFSADGFVTQVRDCLTHLRDPVLAWVSVYVVTMLVLEHVPYEFAQPYTALVLGEVAGDVTRTPAASAVLYAAVYGVASIAAGYAMTARERLGVGGSLIAVTVLQTAIIWVMAAFVHPLVLVLILARSIQPAISQPIVNATCSPRVGAARRATFFSLQSLAGRLGYAVVLVWLAHLAGADAAGDAATLGRLLSAAALLGIAALTVLLFSRSALRELDEAPS